MQVLRCGNQPVRAFAQTANVSSNGVLFHSDINPEVGDPLEYLLTLIPDTGVAANIRKPVQLHCMGKVVRQDDGTRTAAATLERYEFLRD